MELKVTKETRVRVGLSVGTIVGTRTRVTLVLRII